MFGSDTRLPMVFQYNPLMHHIEARVRIAADEPHAVRQVLDSAEAGDLVVIAADDIETCHAEVQRFKDRTEPLEVTIGDIPNLDHFAPGEAAKQAHPM